MLETNSAPNAASLKVSAGFTSNSSMTVPASTPTAGTSRRIAVAFTGGKVKRWRCEGLVKSPVPALIKLSVPSVAQPVSGLPVNVVPTPALARAVNCSVCRPSERLV